MIWKSTQTLPGGVETALALLLPRLTTSPTRLKISAREYPKPAHKPAAPGLAATCNESAQPGHSNPGQKFNFIRWKSKEMDIKVLMCLRRRDLCTRRLRIQKSLCPLPL
uniref:Uncharacterized protein n=1 Tax=Sphaerodactylus townsendi TaxID=933632 RepID=A0ACB8ED65_9SAUR